MIVMAPRDENELRHMLKTAVDHNGPIGVRYPRGTAVGVELDSQLHDISIGKAEILENGDDVLILAIGRSVQEALEARQRLQKDYVRVTVVDCRFVKPLDTNRIIGLARRIPRIVTAEENVCQGGFGSAVLEVLSDAGLTGVAIQRVGVGDTFVEHGAPRILRARYGVDAAAIVRAAQKVCCLASAQTLAEPTICTLN